ncbi:unnamed protein product [Citrullus colocynthis]|uniref:EF-hand domain-containing protein n=1 Tax=Citrullus colocynthis TaxID=252529 RepID=A0ABP0YBW5_9ROSI
MNKETTPDPFQTKISCRKMGDSGVSSADYERIFKRFDANGDGKISATELGDALNGFGVSAEDAKRMMDAIDKDGDGCISFEEFADFAKDNRALMKDFAKAF